MASKHSLTLCQNLVANWNPSLEVQMLPSEAMTKLVHYARNKQLQKIESYNPAKFHSHDDEVRGETFANSMETVLNGISSSKPPATDGPPCGLSLEPPTSRLLRKSASHIRTKWYQSDSSPYANTRNKRQKIDYDSIRNLSPTKSESSELDTEHHHDKIACDDSQYEIQICLKSGCKGNDRVNCDQGDQCSISVACNEECLSSENTQSDFPREQWSPSYLRRFEDPNPRQPYANALASYFSTSTSPSPTTPFLSNNSSTIYSSHAEILPSDGLFSPQNSYQDLSDISYANVEACYPPADGSNARNKFEPSWNNSGQFSDNPEKSLSFQCPWLDCSRVIENGEQWNQHFHQEHIDPQMVYSCPLQSENCPVTMAANPMAHLEAHHGFNFSLNESGYRCPSDACQQGMEYFDQTSFHDHLDHFHATPGSGQLQCRLWACGNWFDDPNKLLSHAMQNHTIPVWNKPTNEQASPTEPALKSQLENQTQTPQNMLDNMNDEILQATNEIFNHQLSLKLEERGNQYPEVCSMKKESIPRVEKYSSHKCLWKDLEGTLCEMCFGSENDLQNHIKESHLEILDNKTGYYCCWDRCTRKIRLGAKAGFSQRGKLERHMATHTNFKCSSCDICGAYFSAPQAMKQHRRLHTGERPWKCQHCEKTFTQQSACTVHERTHTNEKPLECPICFKRFSESSNLTKHRKTHGERGVHVCTFPKCGKTFHRFDQLKRHLLTHPNGARSIDSNFGNMKDEVWKID